MRDHKKLKAFEFADNLVLEIYKATAQFPTDEQFGLISQLRRAAVSIASNIVEGCARNSQADYVHFLNMSYGSSCEAQYQISLAFRLGYMKKSTFEPIYKHSIETSKVLGALILSLKKPKTQSPGAKA